MTTGAKAPQLGRNFTMRTNQNLSIPGTSIRLGDRARCAVTGFEGIVDTYARHLTGCDRVFLSGPAVVHDGEVKTPGRWVDVLLLELVESNPLNASPLPKEVPAAG